MPAKNIYKDKLEDEVLDLSLMQLYEVPVEEIVRTLFINHFYHIFFFTIPTTQNVIRTLKL